MPEVRCRKQARADLSRMAGLLPNLMKVRREGRGDDPLIRDSSPRLLRSQICQRTYLRQSFFAKATQDRGYGRQARYCKPSAWLHPPSLRYGAASWRIPGRKRRCPNFFCRFPHDAVKSLKRKSCWQLVWHKRKVLPSNLL